MTYTEALKEFQQRSFDALKVAQSTQIASLEVTRQFAEALTAPRSPIFAVPRILGTMTEITTSFTFAWLEQQVAYVKEVSDALADRAKQASRPTRPAAPQSGNGEVAAPAADRIESRLTHSSSEVAAADPRTTDASTPASSEARQTEAFSADAAPVQAISEAQRADFVATEAQLQASSEAEPAAAPPQASAGEANDELLHVATGAADAVPDLSCVAFGSDSEAASDAPPAVIASSAALPDASSQGSLLSKTLPAPASITGPRIAKSVPKPAKTPSVSENQTTPFKGAKNTKNAKKK